VADIFLSYKSEDRAQTGVFAAALQAEGFTVWWDPVLRTGETYDETIERELRAAHVIVVLWTPRSVVSRWVRAEATIADRRGALAPVMLEPCERPIAFELVQTADLIEWSGNKSDPRWRALVDELKPRVAQARGRAQSPNAAPPPDPLTIETLFWSSIKDSADRADFETYLQRYPHGHFAELAQNRLVGLKAVGAAASEPARVQPSPRSPPATKSPVVSPDRPVRSGHFAAMALACFAIGGCANAVWSFMWLWKNVFGLPAADTEGFYNLAFYGLQFFGGLIGVWANKATGQTKGTLLWAGGFVAFAMGFQSILSGNPVLLEASLSLLVYSPFLVIGFIGLFAISLGALFVSVIFSVLNLFPDRRVMIPASVALLIGNLFFYPALLGLEESWPALGQYTAVAAALMVIALIWIAALRWPAPQGRSEPPLPFVALLAIVFGTTGFYACTMTVRPGALEQGSHFALEVGFLIGIGLGGVLAAVVTKANVRGLALLAVLLSVLCCGLFVFAISPSGYAVFAPWAVLKVASGAGLSIVLALAWRSASVAGKPVVVSVFVTLAPIFSAIAFYDPLRVATPEAYGMAGFLLAAFLIGGGLLAMPKTFGRETA
jgi:hypothetical protein